MFHSLFVYKAQFEPPCQESMGGGYGRNNRVRFENWQL